MSECNDKFHLYVSRTMDGLKSAIGNSPSPGFHYAMYHIAGVNYETVIKRVSELVRMNVKQSLSPAGINRATLFDIPSLTNEPMNDEPLWMDSTTIGYLYSKGVNPIQFSRLKDNTPALVIYGQWFITDSGERKKIIQSRQYHQLEPNNLTSDLVEPEAKKLLGE